MPSILSCLVCRTNSSPTHFGKRLAKSSSDTVEYVFVDFASKGSLKPLIGDTTFDTKDFVQRQYKRNAGVYYATMKDGDWKFSGDSPNAN